MAAGDIVWTDFNPTVGREQAGRRRALVISAAEFARNTGFVALCPITSKIRPFPTSVVIPDGSPIKGEILVSNIRSVDLRARAPFARKSGTYERSNRATSRAAWYDLMERGLCDLDRVDAQERD